MPPYLSVMTEITAPIGPVLFLDHIADGAMHLSALFIMPKGDAPAPVATDTGQIAPQPLAEYDRATIWRARFALP
ncbi:MAG: alkaline phosphatase family protein, partial [Alphaproteobacteria bacterium]|nr:alkaline phosphatase family protein [Alphaproteobacteria bacterium]